MSENHTNEFQGNWIPAEVFQMVDDGDISIKEAWLLVLISNLVKHGKDGRDCFASNQYLAKKLQVEERAVKYMLRRLKSAGLVQQTGFDGRLRFLTTSWSNVVSDVECPSRRAKNCTPDVQKIAPIIYKHKKQHSPSLRSDTFEILSIKKTTNWTGFGQRLRDSIQQKMPNGRTASKWGADIRALHTADGYTPAEIEQVLDWYCKALVREGDINVHNPNYYPVAYSGGAFRKKFIQLSSKMRRDYTKEGRAIPTPKQDAKLYKVKSIGKMREATSEEWDKYILS